jgi:hypothetical protein
VILGLCQLFMNGKIIVNNKEKILKASHGLFCATTILLTEISLSQIDNTVVMLMVLGTCKNFQSCLMKNLGMGKK